MNSLLRNKRELYLCKRYIDEETMVTKFKRPVNYKGEEDKPIKVDWQPISTDSEVLSLGIDYSKYIRIKGTVKEMSIFGNKDRCYVYAKPDFDNFDEMCNDADYEVVQPPVNMLNDGEVMLMKLSGE